VLIIIVTVLRSLSMTMMICIHAVRSITSSGITTIIVDVSTTSTGIVFDERLEKCPQPRRKRCHAGSEIGFERRPSRRIVEKLGELALDLIALSFTDQEVAQPVKRLDDAHRRSSGPE
jgi:hypothetical protein